MSAIWKKLIELILPSVLNWIGGKLDLLLMYLKFKKEEKKILTTAEQLEIVSKKIRDYKMADLPVPEELNAEYERLISDLMRSGSH